MGSWVPPWDPMGPCCAAGPARSAFYACCSNVHVEALRHQWSFTTTLSRRSWYRTLLIAQSLGLFMFTVAFTVVPG